MCEHTIRRAVAAAVAAVAASAPVAAQHAICDASARGASVETAGSLASIHALDARLGDLLAALSRCSGLLVLSQEPLNERVTITLEATPLHDALRRLLRHRSFALHFGDAGMRLRILGSASTPGALAAATGIDKDRAPAATDPELGAHGSAIVTVAAGHTDPGVRADAVLQLGELGGAAGIDLLSQALIDADREVREAAIDAFIDVGGDAAALALAPVLADGDVALRRQAAGALGEIGGPVAIALLRQALADDAPPVRDTAADVLAELDVSDR